MQIVTIHFVTCGYISLLVRRGVNIVYVYHRTSEDNAKQIMKDGLSPSYRNKGKGYTLSSKFRDCENALDLVNGKLLLNKPKRMESNFAWLYFEDVNKLGSHPGKNETILQVEIDPKSVFVSNHSLFMVVYDYFKHPGFRYSNVSFEEIAYFYWLNMVSLDAFSLFGSKIRFPEGFNEDAKTIIQAQLKTFDLYEVLIPYVVKPSKISSL